MKTNNRVEVGAVLAPRELVTMHGERVRIPDLHQLIHLQFRRFAGCPVCNLHLHSIVRRHSEIKAASIREVVVFHSTAEELIRHADDLPFAVIADPGKQLYAEFGVGSATRALLDPRAWPAIVRGVLHSFGAILYRRQAIPSLNPKGGPFGLPADFLIASDGRIVAAKYGSHADDQWSVDELLALSRQKHSSCTASNQVQTATNPY